MRSALPAAAPRPSVAGVNRPEGQTEGAAAVATARLDKWLWAVRLFKTRSLAAQACTAGHVKLNGARVKPAHTVRPGQLLEVQLPGGLRSVKVLGLPGSRVGAKLVPRFLEDLTPWPPPPAVREPRVEPLFHRPKGSGRPTKRDRRRLREFGLLPPDD